MPHISRGAVQMSRARIPAIARLPHRRALLEELIGYLTDVGGVSNQDIRSAVTKEEYCAYRAELLHVQPPLRKLPGGSLDGIKRYLELLGNADRLHGRAANAPSPKKRSSTHPSLFDRAERAYEYALEALDELVSATPGAAAFFDRPVTFTLDRYPTLDPDSMPRLHTSRSSYALHFANSKESSIYRLKVATLQTSLDELYSPSGTSGDSIAWEDLDIDAVPRNVNPFAPPFLDEDLL